MRLAIPAVLALAVLFLIGNSMALAAGSWESLGRKITASGRTLLHLAHMDEDTYPNRETRRRISAKWMGSRLWQIVGSEVGAVTLAQAKLNALDDIDVQVINEFQKSSYMLDNLTFDDVVNPGGRGSTFTYGYTRQITQATAQFRAINAEYTPQEITKARFTVDLKVFGGAFEIDRALRGIGAIDEVDFQLNAKIEAARSLFHDTAINGDSAVNANSFDGLNKMLVGTATEFRVGSVTDWSANPTEAQANDRMDDLDTFLRLLDGKPTALFGNATLLAKISSMGRRAGYVLYTPDAFGNELERYRGIPLINLGEKPGSTSPVIPIETRTVGVSTTGLTDLYAVRFGLDAFHGISLAGRQLVETWLPDFTTAGAVKKGEVEMIAAVVLKRTKAAAVFRNIKVQ